MLDFLVVENSKMSNADEYMENVTIYKIFLNNS